MNLASVTSKEAVKASCPSRLNQPVYQHIHVRHLLTRPRDTPVCCSAATLQRRLPGTLQREPKNSPGW